MTERINTLDFLVGGIKSGPMHQLDQSVRRGVFYVSGKAGDALGTAIDVIKAVYSGTTGLENYLNKDRA